jgi:2-haloacid dehalogenase
MDALAFDVYGTLVDPLAMAGPLREAAGERAGEVAATWRQKQVEYAFRRGLMGSFEPFETCTAQALEFAARSAGVPLGPDASAALLAAYRRLPAFDDAREGLEALRRAGRVAVAFSNGSPGPVRDLLGHAGLLDLLADVVSVAEVRTFKPHPLVYLHLAERVGRAPRETWLVSSNVWDVLGAKAAGLRAAWVRRSPEAVMDPWGVAPDLVVADVRELAARLGAG